MKSVFLTCLLGLFLSIPMTATEGAKEPSVSERHYGIVAAYRCLVFCDRYEGTARAACFAGCMHGTTIED